MRAVVVTRLGGPEVLEVQDVAAPEPGEGQLVVDVHIAGINYRDVYERSTPVYGPGDPPFVAGIEGVGTVASIGKGVTEFQPGDRVGWASAFGSYAEQVRVDAAKALPIPDGLDFETACTLLIQGMTAHYLVRSVYEVKEGDWVLNHAAAGGVGLLLTQMAKLHGARVIGTTSTDEKAALAREAGADEVLRYEDVPERVLELTGGAGVAAVYDGVGRATLEASMASVRVRGIVANYGSASGTPDPVDLMKTLRTSLFVTRPSLGNYTATREELLRRASDVFGWAEQGSLEVRIGGRYPLGEAAQAQTDIASRGTTGKLLLIVR